MAEDWLPHEPLAEPPPKSTARRTLIIWLLLIAMFVALYHLFSTDAPRADAAPPVAGDAAGYGGGWILLAFVGGLVVPIALLVWQFRVSKAATALQRPALDALAEGNYAKAAKLFGEVRLHHRSKLPYRVVNDFNYGFALTRAGDAAAAVGPLLTAERTPKLRLAIRRLAAVELARAFAIGGDCDLAERWLEAARTRTGDVHSQATYEAARGLVLCRRGRLDEALRHYESVWRVLEAQLHVDQMCEPWLLRAYALATTSTPRDGASADTWLRMLRGAPAGELVWLTARWPELETFAITHGLMAARAAA